MKTYTYTLSQSSNRGARTLTATNAQEALLLGLDVALTEQNLELAGTNRTKVAEQISRCFAAPSKEFQNVRIHVLENGEARNYSLCPVMFIGESTINLTIITPNKNKSHCVHLDYAE